MAGTCFTITGIVRDHASGRLSNCCNTASIWLNDRLAFSIVWRVFCRRRSRSERRSEDVPERARKARISGASNLNRARPESKPDPATAWPCSSDSVCVHPPLRGAAIPPFRNDAGSCWRLRPISQTRRFGMAWTCVCRYTITIAHPALFGHFADK